MLDYKGAFTRPFGDIKKLLIGILLMAIPIANLTSLGYILKGTDLLMRKKKELPEWDGWGTLFKMGLIATVVSVIWFFPVMVIGTMALGASLMTIFVPGGLATLDAGLMGSVAITALTAIVMSYFIPSAVMEYLKSGRMKSAFDFGTIVTKVMDKKYFVAWLIMALYFHLGNLLLGPVKIVGPAIVSFLAFTTGWALLAQVYRDSG